MCSISPIAPREHQAAGWRGYWRCCCRRIPQTAPQCLFLFEKILLLNPAAPYKEGPVLSHSPPLQLDQGLSRSGSHTAQLSTPQPVSTVCAGLPLRPYSPPCDFKQPGLSGCCSSLVWQGRGPLTRLSPRSPAAGLGGTGLGL